MNFTSTLELEIQYLSALLSGHTVQLSALLCILHISFLLSQMLACPRRVGEPPHTFLTSFQGMESILEYLSALHQPRQKCQYEI